MDKAGQWNLIVCGRYAFPLYSSLYWIQFSDLAPQERESRVAQNKDLVADAQDSTGGEPLWKEISRVLHAG